MKKLMKTLGGLILVLVIFTGCNEQVPAGYVGKIMGKNGWQPEIYPPSKVYVETTFTTTPERLFLVQTTTQKFKEHIKILLKDKLTLEADIIFRGRVNNQKKVLNFIFNDMTMNDNIIETKEVYHTYGKMIILNTARDIISQYNIDEVNKNYARMTTELFNKLKPKLKNLPISISDVTIGNIQYPEIVTKAIEKAKQKQMAIDEAKAKVKITLLKLKGKEEEAKALYKIKMLEAKRIADYNKKISQGVTKDLLKLRKLEIQEAMIEAIKNNKNVIYMPMDMMNSTTNMRIIK